MTEFPRYVSRIKTRAVDKYRYMLPSGVSPELGAPATSTRWASQRYATIAEAVKARDLHFNLLDIRYRLVGTPSHKRAEPGGDKPKLVESDGGQKGQLSLKSARIQTADQLLKHADVDTDVWEVDREKVNVWDMTNKDGETYQNFQVTLWLKRKIPVIDIDYLSELLKDLPKAKKSKAKATPGNHLLELNICDLHIGKLCWAGETGEDFDMEIAKNRFREAVIQLASLAEAFPVEKILFPIGSDYFNSDTFDGKTSKGTPQDMDGRFPKMYEEGVALLVWAVNRLRGYAPVDVVLVPGNHDRQTSFCAAHCLDMYFRDAPDVQVDANINPRKYIRYHNNMIGLFHGDGVKQKDVFQVMATECSFWSDVKYREAHAGHFHHESVKEQAGLVIRYLSSISGTDAWHHIHGLIGNRKAAQAFVYARIGGLVSNLTVNV